MNDFIKSYLGILIIIIAIIFVTGMGIGVTITNSLCEAPSKLCEPYSSISYFYDTDNKKKYMVCRDLTNDFSYKEVIK